MLNASTTTEIDGPRRCRSCGAELAPELAGQLCPRCAMVDVLGDPSSDKAPPLDLTDILPPPPASSKARRVGDYELRDELGQGGMGTVYRAYQRSLKRMVAVKMINLSYVAGHSEFLRRFHIEAEAIAALKHENIVEIHEAGEHEGQPYFSMELIEGGDLREQIQRQGGQPLPLRAAVQWVAAIARAVHHAHERGILHRDLKPGNILLDSTGKPYVTDFGLARVFQDVEPAVSAAHSARGGLDLTEVGQGMGSPGYTSAEQAEGRRNELTTASDVFSLGAILYHLITGRTPLPTKSWRESDNWEVYVRLARAGDFVRPSLHNPRVDADLDAICLHCLEPDLKRRASSATDLAEQLERWLRHESLDSDWRHTPVWERGAKFIRRHPVDTGLALSVIVGLLLTMGVVHFRQRAKEETTQGRLATAESLLKPDDASEGLAELASLLRQQPGERVATERLVNALWRRVFLLPTSFTNSMEPAAIAGGRFADGDVSPDRRFRLQVVNSISIVLQDYSSGAPVWSITNAHRRIIRDLRWSSDHRHFVSAGADGNVFIWDSVTRTNPVLFEHPGAVYHAELDASGTRLLTACVDKFARLWVVASHLVVGQPMSHEASVASARFSRSGNWVVTVSDEGTVRLWDGATAGPYSEPLRLGPGPGDARFTADGRHIEVVMEENEIRVFKIAQPQARPAPSAAFEGDAPFSAVVETESGRAMMRGNRVELPNAQGGRTLSLVHESTVNCVDFSPDGRRVATSTAGKRARVWDAFTGQPLTDWLDSTQAVARVRFSADGGWLLAENASWEIYAASEPAPDWLAELAVAIAGEKTGIRRISGPASAKEFARVRQVLAPLPPTNRLIYWAKEFVSDEPSTPQR